VSPPSLHSLSVAAMGSFAKVLSQLGNVASARLAAPAATGTSRGIIQGSRANKQGLSLMLDGTLKAGHDMKTFGLGTAASLATVERYARFTAAMHHVYGTMERSFDASTSPVVVPLWQRFGDSLRREPSLALDLADVSSSATLHSRTPATAAYCAAIEDAAARDNADGGGRLIGHLYCRYFADLFGGQALAAPTRYALAPAVRPGTPRHYDFGDFGARRAESVEALYQAFNTAGAALGSQAAQDEVVTEANRAFAHNIAVYSEEGALWSGAAHGVANMVRGFVRAKVVGSPAE